MTHVQNRRHAPNGRASDRRRDPRSREGSVAALGAANEPLRQATLSLSIRS
jgi:hypothetical protein